MTRTEAIKIITKTFLPAYHKNKKYWIKNKA